MFQLLFSCVSKFHHQPSGCATFPSGGSGMLSIWFDGSHAVFIKADKASLFDTGNCQRSQRVGWKLKSSISYSERFIFDKREYTQGAVVSAASHHNLIYSSIDLCGLRSQYWKPPGRGCVDLMFLGWIMHRQSEAADASRCVRSRTFDFHASLLDRSWIRSLSRGRSRSDWRVISCSVWMNFTRGFVTAAAHSSAWIMLMTIASL